MMIAPNVTIAGTISTAGINADYFGGVAPSNTAIGGDGAPGHTDVTARSFVLTGTTSPSGTGLIPGGAPLQHAHQTAGLTVTRAGTGAGTVSSSPAGISCGLDCSELYDPNASVTLTATPAQGSALAGWTGACEGQGSECALNVFGAHTTTAIFNLTSPPAGDDTDPPETRLSGPKGRIHDRTPTFRLGSDEAGSRFECKLDGGPFKACRARTTTRRLTFGKHSFKARAIDPAGNADATVATRRFVVLRP
jgi:hypothetical protein